MFTRVALIAGLMLSSSTAIAQDYGRDRFSFENVDTNRDSRISREEFRAARTQLFVKRDRNGDGYLDQSDMPKRAAQRAAERAAQMRSRIDSDGDGRISKEEFAEADAPMFDHADENGDDVLDAQELADAQAAMQGHMKARRARSR